MEEVNAPAECFPLRVVQRGREYTERAFYCCNFLDLAGCPDLERGEYTFWDRPGCQDRGDKITRLATDGRKAAGRDLFRIAKGAEYVVSVSDRVARRVEERGLTGVRFVNPGTGGSVASCEAGPPNQALQQARPALALPGVPGGPARAGPRRGAERPRNPTRSDPPWPRAQ